MPRPVTVLGVRHHGPGSARAVRRALDALVPDLVVIEGPPELDALVSLAASPALVPPVAALVYAVDEPARASFYPLAVFSPEWVALRWALDHDVAVRFADLPAVHGLAGEHRRPFGTGRGIDPSERPERSDPIAALATAAGYDDPERWWEDAVEHRGHGTERLRPDATDELEAALEPFDHVLGAMAQVRAADATRATDRLRARLQGRATDRLPSAAGGDGSAGDEAGTGRAEGEGEGDRGMTEDAAAENEAAENEDDGGWDHEDERNEQREAAMRRVLRAAMSDHGRIAVVCGAWHAPALVPSTFPSIKADNDRLKGLPKVKVAATWVPWTAGRLSRASGYGAGVTSPGWYAHLFAESAPAGGTGDVVGSWLVKVARCLRDEGLPASPASVVEAVRLATTLAALRGRPLAGLDEVTEAAQAVLCSGSPVPLAVVAERLVVGHDYGRVPDETPMVPLATDLTKAAKNVRLTRTATEKTIELDLRQERGRERSTLFHRLVVLDIGWATPAEGGRTSGTFKETWTLAWAPELEIRLIEASGAGTTIPMAATATVLAHAAEAGLGRLCALVEQCFPADLPEALDGVMAVLAERSAHQHDTAVLMEAVEPLARTCRYGDVRGRPTTAVRAVLDGLVARVCVGLPSACASLDDDAAAALRIHLDAMHRGVVLVDDDDLRARWLDAVATVAGHDGVHGLVAGRLNRLALDTGRTDRDTIALRLTRVLSTAADANRGAAWLDGFLAGDAVLLLHDHDLLATIDGWVAGIGEQRFDDLLPLLRRTFSQFAAAERRSLGRHLKQLGRGDSTAGGTGIDGGACEQVDRERADRVLPRVFELLGVGR